MAPVPASACDWVALDCSVRLAAKTGEKTAGDQSMSDLFYDPYDMIGRQPMRLGEWVREGKVRLHPELAKPPQISSISLDLPALPREIDVQLEGVTVRCADKNLLVLYTGPKSDHYASSGIYLVYDAYADALFVAPPIDWSKFREAFGHAPVVLRHGDGFILVVLVRTRTTTRRPTALLWSGQEQDQWVEEDVSLPPGMPEYGFGTHASFAFLDTWACWVDLFSGLLAINVLEGGCRFVPLPQDYEIHYPSIPAGLPVNHCTMGCVNGAIKFLAMVGYNDQCRPREEVEITTWTLRLELGRPCKWKRNNNLLIRDLWANKAFLTIATQPLYSRMPMCPVLNPKEPDVVSFLLSDIGDVDGRIATRGEIMFAVNTRSNKVESWIKVCPPRRSLNLAPSLIHAEFSAYLQRSSD